MRSVPSASVVIPALDEAGRVRDAVTSVRASALEVIVVDGGSRDATASEAVEAGARVVRAPRGRAAQMAEGARLAKGDWVVFLHADTRLGEGWATALTRLDAGVAGGAFRFRLDSPRFRYRLVEAAVLLRCALLGLPYGDQAIFARRGALAESGAFPSTPILEDVDLVRRLQRRGRLAFPAVPAVTSPRRWERLGFWRTTLLNGCIMALDAIGQPRESLARLHGRCGP